MRVSIIEPPRVSAALTADGGTLPAGNRNEDSDSIVGRLQWRESSVPTHVLTLSAPPVVGERE
jgi:hypothetical protein